MTSTREPAALFIGPVAGFSPAKGHLVSMLSYARWSLAREVEGLSQKDLDYLLDEKANTIGMLPEHIASVEEWYQQRTLGIAFSPIESRRTNVGANLGTRARIEVKGYGLDSPL